MDKPQRDLMRLAELIHQQLKAQATSRVGQVVTRVNGLLDSLAALRHLGELMAICARRGWNAAINSITEQMGRALREVTFHADGLHPVVESCKTTRSPTVSDILADLTEAQEEFEKFHYEPDRQTLSVTVGPIRLEDIYLGEFEIRLQIASLAQASRSNTIYRVVALDPHPAGCNESVTHPHVSDERMCEGEASAAIRSALASGRVCDFFQLVSAVLTTYNPHSPYVALDHWSGRPCHDCGDTLDESHSSYCSACDNDFCESCISYCRVCDESICHDCLERCRVCGQMICSSCRATCPECGERLCQTCLDELKCPCLEETQPDEEDDHDPTEHPVVAGEEDAGGHAGPGGSREGAPARVEAA